MAVSVHHEPERLVMTPMRCWAGLECAKRQAGDCQPWAVPPFGGYQSPTCLIRAYPLEAGKARKIFYIASFGFPDGRPDPV